MFLCIKQKTPPSSKRKSKVQANKMEHCKYASVCVCVCVCVLSKIALILIDLNCGRAIYGT